MKWLRAWLTAGWWAAEANEKAPPAHSHLRRDHERGTHERSWKESISSWKLRHQKIAAADVLSAACFKMSDSFQSSIPFILSLLYISIYIDILFLLLVLQCLGALMGWILLTIQVKMDKHYWMWTFTQMAGKQGPTFKSIYPSTHK